MVGHPHRALGTLITACLLAGAGTAISVSPAQAAAPTAICGPKLVTRVAAPGVGNTAVVKAASAGHVTLMEKTALTLQVRTVAPASRWRSSVVTASGTKIHITFNRNLSTHSIRFYARLNPTGTRITVITVVCT